MQVKVNGWKTNEDAVKVIQEFEEIIQNKKSDIVRLAYHQSQILQKFKERERFLSHMVLKFRVNYSVSNCVEETNQRFPKNKKLFTVSSLF